jgi:hypothetical protein
LIGSGACIHFLSKSYLVLGNFLWGLS